MFWSCCNSLSSNNNPANEEVTVSGSSVEAIDASCYEDAIVLASVISRSDLPLFQATRQINSELIFHPPAGTFSKRVYREFGCNRFLEVALEGVKTKRF
jgi:hypothetical protein